MKEVIVASVAGLENAGGCARSQLGPYEKNFATVFTSDVSKIRSFYDELLEGGTVRYESDDLVVYKLPNGHEVVLQQVGSESHFAEMVGKQSLGFSFPSNRVPKAFGSYASADLPWQEETAFVSDPDGNRLLLARSTASDGSAPDLRIAA